MNIIEDGLELPAIAPGQGAPEKTLEEPFHTSEVATVAVAHGAHDMYFAYLPTILPLLIEKFSLSTTQAGLLTVFSQIPNLLQPLVGHLADRKNLKMLVILAPAISGVLVTLLGVVPSYDVAALLLLLAGFSMAGFHAIAPAMISARSGRMVGRGMGFFMVGGEFGYAIGPLVVVISIGFLTLKGLPWLMTLGVLASVILYFRLKDVSTVRQSQVETRLPFRQAVAEMRGLMVPIMIAVFITGFLSANLVNYLPTFMSGEGAAFAVAGISLTVVELGATAGTFLMGMFSDRFGHRNMAILGTLVSAAFSLGFLMTGGWLQIVMLVGIGLSGFVASPAFLAIIQSRFTKNRSLANGVYMSTNFILRSIAVVIVGMLADCFGMRPVFIGSTLVSLLAIPFMFMLPGKQVG